MGGFKGCFFIITIIIFITKAKEEASPLCVLSFGHLCLQQNFALLMRAPLEAVVIAAPSLSIPISISALLCPTASEVLGTLYNASY